MRALFPEKPVRPPFERCMPHEEYQVVLSHAHRATISNMTRGNTLDEGDLQMSVRAGDSKVSS